MEITPAAVSDSEHEISEHQFMCSKLYIAAFKGYVDEINDLLAGGGGTGGTALEAGYSLPYEAAKAAADHHGACYIDELTTERSTVLHIAARQGHTDLISELCCNHGSGGSILLSMANSSGDTPLHCAARAGHAGAVHEIARLLSPANDVEEHRPRETLHGKNAAGDTALHLAARHGHGAAVEELMAAAPETASEVNGSGVSALYLAVMSRSLRAVRAIVEKCTDASAAGPESQNALHAAVLQNPEMVSLLLLWRPELASSTDNDRSTPLHFASADGDCSMIQAILSHALPGNAYSQDSEGLSALHAAAMMGHGAAVSLLLQISPACADIHDNNGRSFLHAAAMRGHTSIISYALKNRMLEHLLNEQDNEGNTPLHLAIVGGEYKVISKLLSSEMVQNHIMNNVGQTPSDLAEKSIGFYTMVRIVVKLYVSKGQFHPKRQDHIVKWDGQNILKWQATASKYLAVVSTLVATIAFSATFNMPGSYGLDGKANLNGDHMYHAFVVMDTLAMTTSVMATILLVYGRIAQSHRSWPSFIIAVHLFWLSLISMMLAFFIAIIAVMDNKYSMRITLSRIMYSGVDILTMLLVKSLMPGSLKGVIHFLIGGFLEQQRRVKRRINRQYPLISFYIINIIVFVVVTNVALVAINVVGSLR